MSRPRRRLRNRRANDTDPSDACCSQGHVSLLPPPVRVPHLPRDVHRSAKKKKPCDEGFFIGAPRFELGTSCPPDKRANQAAPRPVPAHLSGRGFDVATAGDTTPVREEPLPPSRAASRNAAFAIYGLDQPLVEAVDQLGHRLELLGDHPQAVLAEMLRLDAERVRDALDHVVRRAPAGCRGRCGSGSRRRDPTRPRARDRSRPSRPSAARGSGRTDRC